MSLKRVSGILLTLCMTYPAADVYQFVEITEIVKSEMYLFNLIQETCALSFVS
jgi:hypothetical protein